MTNKTIDKKGLGKKVLDSAKYAGRIALAGSLTFFVGAGIYSIGSGMVQDIKDINRFLNQKQAVINYVDKDNNGLSHKEQFKIYNLMEVEDSSKTYKPTTQDWKRAYNKIKDKE
jgi:hypothetical protein